MESIRDRRNKEIENDIPRISPLSFESITEKFLSSSQSEQIKCPTCGNVLDFKTGVKWYGPDTFTCSRCGRLLSMLLIHRALRDLGFK